MKVSLKILLIVIISLKLTGYLLAQSLKPFFNLTKPFVCKNENLQIVNTSQNASSYLWDFCHNDLLTNPSSVTSYGVIVGAARIEGIEVVYWKGNWYGFILNRDNHKLLRLDFDATLSFIENTTDLGTFGLLNVPTAIRFIKENNYIYALVTSSGNNKLIRLNFGEDITSNPTTNDLGNLSSLSNPFGLDVAWDGSSYFTLVTNFTANKVTIINFGNTITNNPTATDRLELVASLGFSQPFGVSIGKDDGNWYAFVSNFANGKILRLNFSDEIYSIPTIDEIGNIPNPTDLRYIKEGTEHRLFVIARTNGLRRYTFKSGLSGLAEQTYLGTFGELTDVRSLAIVKTGTLWKALSGHFNNNNLYNINFQGECSKDLSINSSQEDMPENIQYFNSGTYPIELTAYDSLGNFDTYTDTVVVRDATAPTLSISTDNACIDNENRFSGVSSDDASITSWSWDFGDGTGAAAGQNANYQFSQTGNYDIRLSIETADGCSNSVMKTIPIFETPITNFTFPTTSACSNSPVSFTNSTSFQGPDSLLSFSWNLNEEMLIKLRDATHTFTTGGSKDITLTASIPGCTSSVSKPMEIIPGPATSFSFEGSCEYDLFKFANQTIGESITGYQWNFGDGYTSSVASPTHRFSIPNNYIVSLTATNAFGCQTTLDQVVPVHTTPQLNFTNDLACAGSEITFYDQSSAVGANIIDRHWRLSNTEHNYYKNASGAEPAFLTDKAGTYSMELIGITNYGCADTLIRDVNIKPSPRADFTYDHLCYGDSTLFQQAVELPGNSQLLSVNWMIDGNLQTGFETRYKFPSDGLNAVDMYVRADNLCTSHIQKQIRILPLPTAVINLSSQCTNQPVHVSPIVDADSSDPAQQYLWSIDGKIISTQQNFNYTFNAASSYVLALSMNTANNCQFSKSETFSIHPTPVSAFEIFPSMGASPLNVQFTDRSTGAGKVTYHFSIQNDEISADRNPVYKYNQLGYDYPYQVAENQYGCRDTSYATIQVVHPVYDLAISEVGSEITDQKIGLYVTLENLGTIIINNPVIKINLDKNISLQQQLSGKLLPGENRKFEIDFEVLQRNSSIQYICFSLENAWAGYSDANSENNAQCLSLENAYIVMEPFPNPSVSHVSIPVILPQPGDCEISLFDNAGNLILGKKFNNLQTGLNTIRLDLSLLTKGVYLTHIRHQDFSATKKIILN